MEQLALINAREAARITGYCRQRIWQLRKDLQGKQYGRIWLFPREQVLKLKKIGRHKPRMAVYLRR